MRAVIIDNESRVVQALEGLLKLYCPEVELVGKANGCATGEALLLESQPELIFLDVEMDDGTGIELMTKLYHIDAFVVFITAHDKYAMDAFRCSALDFLLKPINPEDLTKAVEKCKQARRVNDLEKQVAVLTDHLSGKKSQTQKIVLSDFDSMHLVNIQDIVWCLAEGSYTKFRLTEGQEIMVSKNLKSYEDLLAGHNFVRIHNSYLVNINHVKRFERSEGGILVMDDGANLPVSVRKKDALMTVLKNWNG